MNDEQPCITPQAGNPLPPALTADTEALRGLAVVITNASQAPGKWLDGGLKNRNNQACGLCYVDKPACNNPGRKELTATAASHKRCAKAPNLPDAAPKWRTPRNDCLLLSDCERPALCADQ